MRAAAVAALAAGLLGVCLALAPATAWAHGEFVSSAPGDGQRLGALPAFAVLTFSDEQTLAQVVVTGPQGQPVALGEASVSEGTVTQAMQDAGQGQYTLAYRTTSRDGHVLTGQISFSVGEPVSDSVAESLAEGTSDATAPSETAPAAQTGSASPTDDVTASLARRDVVVPVSLFLLAGLLWLFARRIGPA